MSNYFEYNELLWQIKIQSSWILKWCERFDRIEFGSSSPHILAKVIKGLTLALEKNINYWQIIYNEEPKESIYRLNRILNCLRILSSNLELIRNSEIDLIPWSIIEPIERTFRLIYSLNGKKTDLFLCSQWVYNYSILINFKELYLNLFEKEFLAIQDDTSQFYGALNEFKNDFHILSIPATDRMNPLRLSLISHEIGHSVAKEIISSDFEERYRIELKNELLKKLKNPANSEELKETTKYWRKALEEMLSDYFGVRLWGISTAFSIYSIAIEEGLDNPKDPSYTNEHYPSWRRRLKIVFRALKDMKLERLQINEIFNKNIIGDLSKAEDILKGEC